METSSARLKSCGNPRSVLVVSVTSPGWPHVQKPPSAVGVHPGFLGATQLLVAAVADEHDVSGQHLEPLADHQIDDRIRLGMPNLVGEDDVIEQWRQRTSIPCSYLLDRAVTDQAESQPSRS